MDSEFAEHETRMRSWVRRTPSFRGISARTGLQGKLVLSFMLLLVATLGAASFQFVEESRAMTREVLGSKAMTIAGAVAATAEGAMEQGDTRELAALGRKLLVSPDVAGLVFFNHTGELIGSSWQDGDRWGHHTRLIPNPRQQAAETFKVHNRADPALGPYLELTVPVRVSSYVDGGGPGKIVGFVTVCLSRQDHAQRIAQAQRVVVLIGAFSVLVSLPLVYALVHRIFQPIRVLVDATRRIAAGQLETEVAIRRPDVIGTLARSFNEMARKIREQQNQLETANANLAAANCDLEQKIRQRTGQVEAANGRLRSEIAEKEDFLRAVSHDLNAPLRNIAGMTTMLLLKHRESFNEDVIHRLERIQKNVEVETDLISELLELSRIKTRRQKVEPVDLGALVGELAGMFENDLRTREIALTIDTPLPVVECERARMRQVFQNLIDNAIKYMGEGSERVPGARIKEIHVGCAMWRDEAEFYVRDTGIGIEPEDLDKVFFVFRRGKNPAVQAVAGKGIGLASVKSIVETYDGTIWVESRVGQGTTFRFTVNGKHVPATKPLAQGRAA